MYVFGEDIAQTDPNVHHVEEALRALDLLVVHDIFQNATAEFAHVMLPGSSFLEKTGTFTNAERRVQLVHEAVKPPGNARRDLDILFDLSDRLGYAMPHLGASEVMDEIAELTPPWRGISYERLGTQGLQWPVPDAKHPGTPILYQEHFGTPSGRANLFAVDWEPPGESASDEFPFILITGASSPTTTPAHRRGAPATSSCNPRTSSRSTRRTPSASARRTATSSRSRARAQGADPRLRDHARRARQRLPLVSLPRGEDEPPHERQRRPADQLP